MKSTILPLFDLQHDKADPASIDHAIRQGAMVAGTNLWVLFFAILIASIGLNVNSTAVIIGAMLISPLMGPIIAIGYGVATNDAALIRSSLRNLGLFVAISLVTSVLYFKLSPLSLAHSELLARTTPTLWDVLIAFFGGAAGIIALTRKHASPIIPGVAIATALMPPLCTAGYGLASGNLAFFGGAFYLFAINSVFIALATALFVKLMRLPAHAHASPDLQRRTRIWVSLLLLAMLLPSIWLGYRLVMDELFLKAANAAVDTASQGDDYFELTRAIDTKQQKLTLTIGGGEPPADLDARIKTAMRQSGFPATAVSVRYIGSASPGGEVGGDIQTAYTRALTQTLVQEILAQYPAISSVVIAEGSRIGRQAGDAESLTQVSLFLQDELIRDDQRRLEAWLKARFKSRKVVLLTRREDSPDATGEQP